MAANRAAKTTPMPVTFAWTVLATVLATAVPTMNTAAKLKNAENQTAALAGSARVATTVETELAASWNPLVKSNRSASATTAIRAVNVRSTRVPLRRGRSRDRPGSTHHGASAEGCPARGVN